MAVLFFEKALSFWMIFPSTTQEKHMKIKPKLIRGFETDSPIAIKVKPHKR